MTADSLPLPPPADPASPTLTRRGPERAFDAVLLASFGGPEAQEEVIPFLRRVTAGRGIPDERLEEVAVHYRTLGGVSPINAQNRRLAAELEAELARRGVDLPVRLGNRNSEPFLADTVRELHEQGHEHLLGLPTSAYSSYSGCRQYREDFALALEETGLVGRVTIDRIRAYFNAPGFLEPTVDGLREAISDLVVAGHDTDRIAILFSTHSIPLAMAEASGPEETRAEGSGGWYLAQHVAACRWVWDRLDDELPHVPDWRLVYQSRSGAPHVPWLEPDVNDVIEEIAAKDAADAVVVVPIGFVSDHMEVVWDLDHEAADTAAARGLDFRRVPTPAADPRFVAALADLVQERLEPRRPRAEVTCFGPTPDVCGTDCCAGRLVRPTVGALDSEADLARWRAASAKGGARATGTASAEGVTASPGGASAKGRAAAPLPAHPHREEARR